MGFDIMSLQKGRGTARVKAEYGEFPLEGEFRFDPDSAQRILKAMQNYPICLKDCADIIETVAPLCGLFTKDGFLKRLEEITK